MSEEEDRIVDNLIAIWDRILCGSDCDPAKDRPPESLSAAEADLLYLKPETLRGAEAKLLLMNSLVAHSEASAVYDGGRQEFREERDRLVKILIEAKAASPLLAHYLPDV